VIVREIAGSTARAEGQMENTKPHTAIFFLAIAALLAIFGETVYAVGHYLLR
jgi:hypothetical protein